MTAAIVDLDVPWKSRLILGDKGPRALLANVITSLKYAPEWQGKLFWDEFNCCVIASGDLPWEGGDDINEPWSDGHDTRLTDWLQKTGIHVKPDSVGRAVEFVARTETFHPIVQFFNELPEWQPEHPHCGRWLVDFCGAEENDFNILAGMMWLISAVARVMEPGCKVDTALILEGPQGSMKSTVFHTLGGEWFTDEIADLGSKDAAIQLAGAWIIELAELDSMSRVEVGRVKAFMSRRNDRFVPKFSNRTRTQPRQCVFAGTVNHGEYLKDETGARRFWPVKCGKIDIPGLKRARTLLWAHAFHLWKLRTPWWFTGKYAETPKEAQDDRYQHDIWEELIENYARGYTQVTVMQIMAECLKLPNKDMDQIAQNRVARALRALGWERKQVREGASRKWLYVRPASAQSPVPAQISEDDYRPDFE